MSQETEKPEDTENTEETGKAKKGKKEKTPEELAARAALKKKVLGIVRWVFLLLSPFILLGIFLTYDAVTFLSDVPEATPQEKEIVIMPGTNFKQVAELLYKENLITDVRRFIMYARYKGITDKIRSGYYTLSTGWTATEMVQHFMIALPKLETITIPEGLSWWEVGKRLEEAGLVRFADFENSIHDPAFLRYWGIPFKNAEGFLFPDTYKFLRPLVFNEHSAKNIIGSLIDNFWKRTAHIWPDGKRPGIGNNQLIHRIITLGSIIEKETAVPSERARVAGVYTNRLHRTMRLQADPTTIYGIGPSFDGNLTRKHLQDQNNPYNTYRVNNLPPGPICSPGLASMEAAQNPERHDYLYFVARANGTHSFSTNLQEHNRAVNLYQRKRPGDSLSILPGAE